jgi:ParB/RepB/Spo0J family partition protein
MSKKEPNEKSFEYVVLAEIQTSPMNPRTNFEGKKFDELVASIRKVGVIEPILVRPISLKKKPSIHYEIVAGERRYRAINLVASENGGAEKQTIPAIVQKMSDDDAFDLMTIENLQREDLTELEEANSFKIYLDKKGMEALPELCERTGINPQYIRRRLAVLTLPSKIVHAWEKGVIKYGHCEQLLRLKDKKVMLEYFQDLLPSDGGAPDIESIKELRYRINSRSISLAKGKFRKDEAGCLSCLSNSDCQAALFQEKYNGTFCNDTACFKIHQEKWLTENWKKYAKQIGTNGFRYRGDLDYGSYQSFGRQEKPGEQCKECAHFISVIDLDGTFDNKEACVGDKSCYNQIIRAGKPKGKGVSDKKDGKVDPDAPRVSWHGQFFREEFYKTRIPEAIALVGVDDLRCLRLSLLSLLYSNHDTRAEFARQWIPKYAKKKENDYWFNIDFDDLWEKVNSMSAEEISQTHRDIAAKVIMQVQTVSPNGRHQAALLLKIDLVTEWRITKEYLAKKTTKEILNMIAQFEIDKDKKALAFLEENLNKKRGRFDTCKKSELVSIMMDSGIELAGKVPKEILTIDDREA